VAVIKALFSRVLGSIHFASPEVQSLILKVVFSLKLLVVRVSANSDETIVEGGPIV